MSTPATAVHPPAPHGTTVPVPTPTAVAPSLAAVAGTYVEAGATEVARRMRQAGVASVLHLRSETPPEPRRHRL